MKSRIKKSGRRVWARAAVSGGLAFAPLHPLLAQDVPESTASNTVATVEEITVTASRRQTSVEELPYNISAIGGDELLRSGTQDIRQLANQVPGFDMSDRGRANLAAEIPIIRGMNASDTTRGGNVFEQSPVATYLGDSPMIGYFPLDDIQRIEVLRGPQGTLYGAGALGGAIRFIPNAPQLKSWEAKASVSGESVAHSSDMGYVYSGLVNVPIGEIAAFRLSARREYDAGFIDQFGIERRQGNPITSAPILADPDDVAGSPGVYYNQRDVNHSNVRSGRASLLVEPSDALKIELAFNISRVKGQNAPVDIPSFGGGPWPVDPRITLPAGGEYRYLSTTIAPYSRKSNLSSLDVSYDMGFATLSSTSSYYDTEGEKGDDANIFILSLPSGYIPYYAGNPMNPRFVVNSQHSDSNRAFVQELRLVSNGQRLIDYAVGLFYQREHLSVGSRYYEPGTAVQAAASGGFPVNTGPSDLVYISRAPATFEEKAIFGEATWNVTDKFKLTAGGRFFRQEYSQTRAFELYLFDTVGGSDTAKEFSNHIFKFNASYEYLDNHRVYATFSQGFRRGGANAFQTAAGLPSSEPASLIPYQPDKANNSEIGVKGVFENGIRYTADIFHVDWDQPQIGTSTPANGWPVVVNVPKARTQGAELEMHIPLFLKRLNLSLGYAYVDAELTQDFCLPSGNGAGGVLPCGLNGRKGEVLPGAPKNSAVATLSYTTLIDDESSINYTLNGNYKGSVLNVLGRSSNPFNINPSYTLVNASATYQRKQWSIGLVGTNLFDRRVVYSGPLRPNSAFLGALSNVYFVGQPRTLSLNLTYGFSNE